MPTDIRTLDEVSLNALPALQQIHLDGWVVRFADGYTGRGNSVNPLYPGTHDVDAKIDRCERLYAARSIPCLFKLTSAAHPADLDQLLDRRGYVSFNRTSVQCLSLKPYTSPPVHGECALISSDTPAEAWLAAFAALRDLSPSHAHTFSRILANLALPTRYLRVERNGQPVACGLAVAESSYVGLFDITTHPDHRQAGFATRLVHSLLQWGQHQGAATAYLQVMTSNPSALTLYQKLGFREHHQYWYRKTP